MSQQTLQNQQQSRKQATEGGNAQGVVGKLDQPPVKRFEDFDPESWDKEKFIVSLYKTSQEFQQLFPQVPIDDSQAGQHNIKVIEEFLRAHGVAGNTLRNLQACVEDSFGSLIFLPNKVGLSASPATGSDLMKQLTSEHWERLTGTKASKATISEPKSASAAVKPTTYAAARAQSTDERTLSAEEYRHRNPNGWSDLRQQVADEDAAYVASEVAKFLRSFPQYSPSDENRNLIAERIKAVGGRITQTTIAAAFRQLVAEGKAVSNGAVEFHGSGIKRTDFGAAVLPEQRGQRETPGQTRNAPAKEKPAMTEAAMQKLIASVPAMDSATYLRHLQTNPEFRRRMNGR